MAMTEDGGDSGLRLRHCPDWLDAIPAIALKRAAVAGCGLFWLAVIVLAFA